MNIKFFLPVLSAGLFLAGCGEKEPPKPAPAAEKKASSLDNNSSGSPLTAPVDYLGTLAKGKKTAEGTIDSAALTQQVQLFFAQEGRYPKTLEELVEMKYLKSLPAAPYGMKLDYDAAKGTVKVVKQ